MYVCVYYVHSISCMCIWLADCWLWYVVMCMISWMIHPPCEITDQLAVGTQNCFSTLFYTPKTSAQNAPKCTLLDKKSRNFLGRGTAPSPTGEGIALPRPHRPRRLDSRAFGARRSCSFLFTTRTMGIRLLTVMEQSTLKCSTHTHCWQLPVFQSPCTDCPPPSASSHPTTTIICIFANSQ